MQNGDSQMSSAVSSNSTISEEWADDQVSESSVGDADD